MSSSPAIQLSWLGRETPAFDAALSQWQRRQLDDASWIDYAPQLVTGHATLLEQLRDSITFRSESRVMYDHEVDVPRLVALLPDDGPVPALLAQVAATLSERYAHKLDRISLAYYRDGRDSVAWHRDRVRNRKSALVAILSLGEPRRFMVRPHGGGGSSSYSFGHGDLLVMGGACQERWEHAVPKVSRAQPRMSIMFRNRDNAL